MLPIATLVHNNSANSTTRLAPNQLLIGREPPATPAQGEGTDNPLAEQRVRQLHERRVMVTQALNKAAQKEPLDPPRFTKGQKVWLDGKGLALPYGSIKLAPKQHGPFEIEEVRSPVVYQLKLLPQWTIHPVFHASLLTPYIETNEHGANYMRPPPDVIEGEEQYEVKTIRAYRWRNRKLQYLIKWKGYPESDNTWEPVSNVQAPLLIREYHEAHPLEDKKAAKRPKTTLFPLTTSQPTWLIESDHQNTFEAAEKTAARLAAAATTPPPKATLTAGLPKLTPEQPPQNPYALLTSILETSSVTLPSFPHINSSTSTYLRYPIFVPQFTKDVSGCQGPPSATSRMPTALNTNTIVKTLAALLTSRTRCPARPHLTPPTARRRTRQMSQAPPSPQPLRRSRCIRQLPPSHSPSSLPMRKGLKTKTPSPTSSNLSETSTHQSLQDRLKPSSLSTHYSPLTQPSLPPSAPRPMGLSPLFASERPTRLKSSKKQSTRSPDSRQSTNSDKPTTDNCELNWACSQFPLALNVTRAKLPPQSQQEEAR
jgi:hypothetical protein